MCGTTLLIIFNNLGGLQADLLGVWGSGCTQGKEQQITMYSRPKLSEHLMQLIADRMRLTAGVGLRIQIPAMGPAPLAFDFGIPIESEPGDEERVFSFYIGINR